MNLGLSWRPEIDNDVLLMLENKELFHSSDEKEYLLGAAYYIDQYKRESGSRHLSLHKSMIQYRGKDFTGIGFAEPWDAWGGSGPSALAFVPQFKFGERLHHDFGVFYSGEHAAVWEDSYKQSWQFQFAIEVDVHPSHRMSSSDWFRDSLVSYYVLRLDPETDKPLTWFERIVNRDYKIQMRLQDSPET